MNIEQARSILYTELAGVVAGLTPVPAICWDNRNTVDLGTSQEPHVEVEFIVHSSSLKSLGRTKVFRYDGVLALLIRIKSGEGIAKATTWATGLCSGLQTRNFSGLQTKEAKPQKSGVEAGWYLLPVSVPFWFDEVVDLPD